MHPQNSKRVSCPERGLIKNPVSGFFKRRPTSCSLDLPQNLGAFAPTRKQFAHLRTHRQIHFSFSCTTCGQRKADHMAPGLLPLRTPRSTVSDFGTGCSWRTRAPDSAQQHLHFHSENPTADHANQSVTDFVCSQRDNVAQSTANETQIFKTNGFAF